MKRTYNNYEYAYSLIPHTIHTDTRAIIVIPAFHEKNIAKTLKSILHCALPKNSICEILVVINESLSAPEKIKTFHKNQYQDLLRYSKTVDNPQFRLFPIHAKDLNPKYSGVGLARKIGMDEATRRFLSIEYTKGVIISLDADVVVESNLIEAVVEHHDTYPRCGAASIYFEHELNPSLADSSPILQYENHLRYMVNIQRSIGLPFAYYTIGSAMSVKCSAYISHFGMNKRQAGEDFYFLRKFIKSGSMGEINRTMIRPSARVSSRVPFGTGQSLSSISKTGDNLKTYNYRSFLPIEKLVKRLHEIYKDPKMIDEILSEYERDFFKGELIPKINEIRTHTASFKAFHKRFFRYFDSLKLIQFLNYSKTRYPDIFIDKAIDNYFKLYLKTTLNPKMVLREGLELLRESDKNGYQPSLVSLPHQKGL